MFGRKARKPNAPAPGSASPEADRRDRDAIAALYDRFAGRIHAYALQRLHDPELAADITGTVFARALAAIPSFDLMAPETGRDGWNGVAIGVSPNGGCLVYTEVGQGEEPATSWIAPLEPEAEWTELPFELGFWIEMPTSGQ